MDTENIKWLKSSSLILWSVIFMIGCATSQKLMTNYENCVNDPACQSQMQTTAAATTGIASVVMGGLDSPISIPITAAISLLATLLAGIYFGSKKKAPPAPEKAP